MSLNRDVFFSINSITDANFSLCTSIHLQVCSDTASINVSVSAGLRVIGPDSLDVPPFGAGVSFHVSGVAGDVSTTATGGCGVVTFRAIDKSIHFCVGNGAVLGSDL